MTTKLVKIGSATSSARTISGMTFNMIAHSIQVLLNKEEMSLWVTLQKNALTLLIAILKFNSTGSIAIVGTELSFMLPVLDILIMLIVFSGTTI